MLETLLMTVQGRRENPQITPEVWRQILMLLFVQLQMKRRRASLEDTLPDRVLKIILRILPRAIPDLALACDVFCAAEVQNMLLQHPEFRAKIQQAVFHVPDSAFQDEVEVISSFITSVFESAVVCLTQVCSQHHLQ